MDVALFPIVRREPLLVSYWRLNDAQGNSQALDYGIKYGLNGFYNGSPAGGPALIQNDLSAASYVFGPAGESVSIGDAAPLRILGDISIEAWIAPYVASQSKAIVGKMNAGGTVVQPYSLGLSNGQIQLAVGNGTTSTALVGGTPPISIPSHIVATVFRGVMTLYLNGAVVASGSVGAQAVTDGGQPLYIGAIGSATGFNGLISEVALYNGALSASRIARHFTVGQHVLSDPAHYTTIDPPVYA